MARAASTSPTRFYKVDPAWRRLPIEERAGRQGGVRRGRRGAGRSASTRSARTTTAGVRPDVRLLPLEDHGALRGSRRARRRAERRRRSPAGSRRRTRTSRRRRPRSTRTRAAAEDHPQGLAVPRRLPVREGAPRGTRSRRGPPAGDGRAHPRSGTSSTTIHNHTTYSFGIDDQEFMTAFECDEPADFMHLMLTLRETEASPLHRARHADLRRPATRASARRSTRSTAAPPASRRDLAEARARSSERRCAGRARRGTSRSRRRRATRKNASAAGPDGRTNQ